MKSNEIDFDLIKGHITEEVKKNQFKEIDNQIQEKINQLKELKK